MTDSIVIQSPFFRESVVAKVASAPDAAELEKAVRSAIAEYCEPRDVLPIDATRCRKQTA